MVQAYSNTTQFLFLEEPVKQEAVVKQEIKQEKPDDKANSIKPPPEKRAKLTRWPRANQWVYDQLIVHHFELHVHVMAVSVWAIPIQRHSEVIELVHVIHSDLTLLVHIHLYKSDTNGTCFIQIWKFTLFHCAKHCVIHGCLMDYNYKIHGSICTLRLIISSSLYMYSVLNW